MNLPDKKYAVIYADPPWSYRQCGTGPKSRGNAAQHYNTMTTDDICALPVKNLAGGGGGGGGGFFKKIYSYTFHASY